MTVLHLTNAPPLFNGTQGEVVGFEIQPNGEQRFSVIAICCYLMFNL
jgi:hypothetical protein